MLYILAGKQDTVKQYLESINYYVECKEKAVYAKTPQVFNNITKNDTIVLLAGWWAKEWANRAFIAAVEDFPDIKVIYKDAKAGLEVRKSLKSDNIESRFDILDL